MAQSAERTRGMRWRVLAFALLAAVLMVQAPGCSCRAETAVEMAARLAKEETERLERERKLLEEQKLRDPVQLPPPKMMPAGEETTSLFVKPGHWNAIRQPAKGNAQDFDGVIAYEVTQTRDGNESLGTRLVSRRPLVVARDSEKAVDSLFYCPPAGKLSPKLVTSVRDRRSGVPVLDDYRMPLRLLRDHQYHFVVLAREPQRYAYLDSLYSFTAPMESRIDSSELDGNVNALPVKKNYRLVAIPTRDAAVELALPDNPLAWTSIAYILWDDVDPDVLLPAQRDAIVDWLNWGGQLIVSGPNSLELLRGSFLAPLLPATGEGVQEIPVGRLNALAGRWSVGKKGKPLPSEKPWDGVALKPTAAGHSPAGLEGLVVEGRVGRGRIVVTAMALSDPRLLAWSRGVDNFFNAALLRRLPRRFVPANSYEEEGAVKVAVHWADKKEPVRLDPLRNTGFRAFVRDSHTEPGRLSATLADEGVEDLSGVGGFGGAGGGGFARQAVPAAIGMASIRPASTPGGAGAVSNFAAPANAARASLRESAGVSVPDARFVIGCLAAYLFFLVPANWALFAGIGRVELAWVAAPLIAIAGAWVVIQQAQLDIGFVRSRTEIAVLEVQPDTPRAMLTRFTALYTSLSTTYEMEFDNPAVAAPFPRGSRTETFGSAATVAYERLEKARLRDVAVSSSTTEFIRSEEMLDLSAAGVPGSSIAGSIGLTKGPDGSSRVVNRSAWPIEDAILVERPDGLRGAPRLEGCWIGDLAPGQFAQAVFLPIPQGDPDATDQPQLPFARERADAAKVRSTIKRLDIDNLLRIALDPARYESGERRLIALVPQILPGLKIEPVSSQRTGSTLLVNHLGYGPLATPMQDVNGPLDVN